MYICINTAPPRYIKDTINDVSRENHQKCRGVHGREYDDNLTVALILKKLKALESSKGVLYGLLWERGDKGGYELLKLRNMRFLMEERAIFLLTVPFVQRFLDRLEIVVYHLFIVV